MITRREFLTALGIAAGGCALAYAPKAGAKAFREIWGKDWVEVPPGPERWVTSLCRQCPEGCGIRVRLVGDRPTKIDGNPLHPTSRGKLCPKGQAGLHTLNDPDRLKGPLKRAGERGSGKWQEIPWEEGIKVVVTRLQEIRSQETAHTLAVLDGDGNGLMKMLWERFLAQFGSPNYLPIPSGLDYGTVDAFYLMQGIKESVVYDMEMAGYIISFGSDLLQSFSSPLEVMKAFGYLRRGKAARGKIIQVEPRYSVTAAKADEWIPVKPGTEGVLALGMAHFMIKEGLYDKNFVEKYTFGFEDWQDPSGAERQGYKTLVLRHYSPSSVSEITGVPAEIIMKLAREFATQGPSLAIGIRGDIYQQMAVHALNALAGNIDKPGGILTIKNSPALDLPAPRIDERAQKGLQRPPIGLPGSGEFPLAHQSLSRFSEGVLKEKPYGLSTLLVYHCNPLFSSHPANGFSQAMGKIPLIISFSPYMDETAENADLILPDHTSLEKWQSNSIHSFQGFPVIGMGKPVVRPLYNTRNTADLVLEIAKGMGNPLAKAFPWKDSREVLSDMMKKIYEMNKGDLFAPEVDASFLRELARRGWRAPAFKSFEEFWEGMQEKGGWWDPVYSYQEWEQIFQTPSKKFEFSSQILKKKLENHGAHGKDPLPALRASGLEAKGDGLFLPHWESKLNASPGSEKDYPFYLKIFQPLVFAGLIHANQPYLQDIIGPHIRQSWSSWVEINPTTAAKLKIEEGDWVWVESPREKLKAKARLTHGAMPQVVNIPMGLGHKALGRWAKGIGENPVRLLIQQAEPFTGEPPMRRTRVKIYKA